MAEILGSYSLERRIGCGGMAEVFLAKRVGSDAGGDEGGLTSADRSASGYCVVKRPWPALCADPEFVRMFLDEAQIAAQLDHPNIVRIFDLGEWRGQYFMAMEYVPGFDLLTVLHEHERKGVRVPVAVAARLVAQAAAALHHAHTARSRSGEPLHVIHRDVSPSNILLSTSGSVKLIDFGVARMNKVNRHRTLEGTVKGKYAYMAPEQAKGESLDLRADIFSLGLVLFELLTNARAIPGESDAAIIRNATEGRLRELDAFRPEVPAALRRILERCLAVDPSQRFGSAAELEGALEAYVGSLGGEIAPQHLAALLSVVAAEPDLTRAPREPEAGDAPSRRSSEPARLLVGEPTLVREARKERVPERATDVVAVAPPLVTGWPRAAASGAPPTSGPLPVVLATGETWGAPAMASGSSSAVQGRVSAVSGSSGPVMARPPAGEPPEVTPQGADPGQVAVTEPESSLADTSPHEMATVASRGPTSLVALLAVTLALTAAAVYGGLTLLARQGPRADASGAGGPAQLSAARGEGAPPVRPSSPTAHTPVLSGPESTAPASPKEGAERDGLLEDRHAALPEHRSASDAPRPERDSTPVRGSSGARSGQGTLRVRTSPAMRIHVDGVLMSEERRETFEAMVAPGRHEVTLDAPELGLRQTRHTEVSAGGYSELIWEAKKGRVEVSVLPYGDLYVDGRRVASGESWKELDLWEGEHLFRATNGETRVEREERLGVSGGRTTRLELDLRGEGVR